VEYVERSVRQAPNHLVSMECASRVRRIIYFVRGIASTLSETKTIAELVERSVRQVPNHLVSVECVNRVPVAIHFVRESASSSFQIKTIVGVVERSVLVPSQIVPMAPAESVLMD
jgi:hypothetical protein